MGPSSLILAALIARGEIECQGAAKEALVSEENASSSDGDETKAGGTR